MKNPLLVLLCLCAFLGSAKAQIPIEDDWREDVAYLGEELPKRHFNLFAKTSEREFRKELRRVAKHCRNSSKFELVLSLQQLVAGMGDTHTAVNFIPYLNRQRILPIGLSAFGDDYVLLSTTPQYAMLLGWNLVAINQLPIKEVERKFCSLLTIDNVSNVRMLVPQLLSYGDLHLFLGTMTGDTASVMFEKDGQRETVSLSLGAYGSIFKMLQPKKIALCLRNRQLLFTELLIDNDSIYYVQYNKCWGRELEERYGNPQAAGQLPAFGDFEAKVLSTIRSGKMRKLVFDLRFNTGGSSAQFTGLVRKLVAEQSLRSDLKIYCVIGRSTFSSGILNALDLKLMMGACLLGEQTAGKPNHFGEVRSFTLPKSGIEVRYSTKYFKMMEEDMPTLAPDVVLELSVDDYVNGIDPVLEWVRKQ